MTRLYIHSEHGASREKQEKMMDKFIEFFSDLSLLTLQLSNVYTKAEGSIPRVINILFGRECDDDDDRHHQKSEMNLLSLHDVVFSVRVSMIECFVLEATW